jgi:hypothetical protein
MSLSFPTPVSRSSPEGALLSVDRLQPISRRALHKPPYPSGCPLTVALGRSWFDRRPWASQGPVRSVKRHFRLGGPPFPAHGTLRGSTTPEHTEHEERVARSAGAPSPAYAPELGGLRKAVTQRRAKVPGRPGSRPSPRATGSLGSIWAGPDFSLEGQIPLTASGALGAQGTFKTWKGAVPVWNGQSPASPGQDWKHGYSHRSG